MERNLLLLILLFTSLFGGDQFVYWAKLSTKDHVLVGQEFAISPLMVKLSKQGDTICKIEGTKSKNQTSYEYLLNKKNELFECFLKTKVKIFDTVNEESLRATSKTHMTVVPVRFTVEFKAKFANIILLCED